MEGLLATLLDLLAQWDKCFPQKRSALRAKALALSFFLTLGRKMISRTLCVSGRDRGDWSADYRLFSRCTFSVRGLFRTVLVHALPLLPKDGPIAAAYDDTLVRKSGKKIKGTSWQRDPLSPPFTCNFVWGMRYLQASLLLPLYLGKGEPLPPRGLPIQFVQLPKFKKPSRRAPPEEYLRYRELTAKHNMSTTFVRELRYLRHELDLAGCGDRELLAVGDGSFCNQTCFKADVPKTAVLARCRKNARLYRRAEPGGRRFYDPESFTPEEIRQDAAFHYRRLDIFYGGSWHEVRYKEAKEVYWKWGTRRMPLRLIVVAPTPYRRGKGGKLLYRDPAYLLTTDFETSVDVLIQKYFDRWQIEVNFKEEKGLMGLGDAQVWSQNSIPKLPGFVVACYASLLLASILWCGDKRQGRLFELLPRWRKQGETRRPSCLDLLTVLRLEILQRPTQMQRLGIATNPKQVVSQVSA